MRWNVRIERPLERARSRRDRRGLRNMDEWNPVRLLAADQIDLSDIGFWERPLDEREGAFRLLRRERPLAFFKEPPVLPELALFVPEGPGYRAVTRHAHIVEVSRHPEIYQSGKGATSIPDMPEELLEYFGSMVNTDDPRHAQLRRIVSAGVQPPHDQEHRGSHRVRGQRGHQSCRRPRVAATSSWTSPLSSRSRSSAA